MENSTKTSSVWLQRFAIDEIAVAPSLLAADFAHLADEVRAVENAGAKILHLDIMDGHFVPNISYGADIIAAIRSQSSMLFDTHLMISHPRQYITNFRKVGSDSITIHVECEDDIAAALDEIHASGAAAGLSLKPGTPVEAVLPYLPMVDLILVMTVEPGFGGQSFMQDQMPKMAALRDAINARGLKVCIEVDGGVAPKTAPQCIANGAQFLVAGSSVFRRKGEYAEAIRALLPA
jgi:ribulose-phosphate 3-epimerase